MAGPRSTGLRGAASLQPCLGSGTEHLSTVDCRPVACGLGGRDKRRGQDSRPGFKVDQHKTAIERVYDAGTSTGGRGKPCRQVIWAGWGLKRRCGSLHRSLGAGKEKLNLPRPDPGHISEWEGGRAARCEMPAFLFCQSGLDAAPSESRLRYLEYLMIQSVCKGGCCGTRSESSSGDGDLERPSQL